jgi:tRNA G10  N-methylase Trm11
LAEDRFILVTAQGELSLAEAAAYLNKTGAFFQIESSSSQTAVLYAPRLDTKKMMNRLGGLFKIGSAACIFNEKDIDDTDTLVTKLNAAKFYDWVDDKARWSISTYSDETGFNPDLPELLQEYFKQRLRKDHVSKPRYVPPKHARQNDQEIIADELIRQGIMNGGFEIMAAHIADKYYVGRTLEAISNEEYRKRDLGRPVQNPRLTIPPKIARILINLTGLGPGQSLLDPFCGLGTILQEAAILGIHITGCDIRGDRVEGAAENLKWLTETYHLKIRDVEKHVFKADAKNLSQIIKRPIDGIATEPILLPPLRSYPSETTATKMLQEAAETYEETIPEIAAVLRRRGKLVLVAPYIQTNRGSQVSFNLEDVFREAGLKPHTFTHLPSLSTPVMAPPARDQKIRRGVYVLEKL